MMKSCIMRAGWKTIAIVCSKQKDGGDALVKASVYVRLRKPGNTFFFFFYARCWKRKCRSSEFSPPPRLFFFEVDLNALEYSVSLIVVVSHWKAAFKRCNREFSTWLNARENTKRACGYLGILILMISSIIGHFLYTHPHTNTHYSYQAISRHTDI